jgi:signal transduction histidine kinase
MATASVSGLESTRRSEMRVVVVLAVGAAGVVATALTVWAVARSPILVDPTSLSIWRGLIVALYVAVGLYTWWRRPDSRLGPLVVGNGFLYAATSFNASGASPAYTLGMVMWAVYVVYTAYVLLSYPRGRLESRLERAFIRAYAVSTAVLTGLTLALSPTFPAAGAFNDCGTRCPANALVGGDAVTGTALNTAASAVFTIALIGLTMLLFDKARASGPVLRRAVTPVAAVFTATVAWFVISLYLLPAYPATASAVRIVDGALGVAIPIAILLGLVWGDLFAAISLSQIAVRASGKPLTPAGVQGVIAEALGDSTIELALWSPDRAGYVDVYGAPVQLPGDTRARGVTRITGDDGPVAALIHDPTLDTDSDVVEGLAATSLMLLENTRLVEELRASRSRIVEAGERERERIERDLHDGAQQRLVAIQMRLDMARELAGTEDLANQLDATKKDAEAAVEELRALARGIYPVVLQELGLAAALRSLGRSFPVPISVTDDGIGRSSDAIEAAIYFVASEAIQNSGKHAGPGAKVAVTLARNEDTIEFTVSDDGVGMSPETDSDGIGIASMRDRIKAVGGHFEIVSAPGQGTSIHGTIPDDEGVTAVPRHETASRSNHHSGEGSRTTEQNGGPHQIPASRERSPA